VDLFVENQLEAYEFLRDYGVEFQLAAAKSPAPGAIASYRHGAIDRGSA
jgi:hypothetical protein